jgi:hypothetical protein
MSPRTMFRPVVSTPMTVSRLISFGMPSHKSEEARSLLGVEELVEQVPLCVLPRWGAEACQLSYYPTKWHIEHFQHPN